MFWCTGWEIFLILATALILLVVVLRKICLLFFAMILQVMFAHLSRSMGSVEGYFYSQACQTANAAQNSYPLSSAGTLDAKSVVGYGLEVFRYSQGRKPPNPGYYLWNCSYVWVFFLSSSNIYSLVYIWWLPVHRALARIPTWIDYLLLAVQ